MISLVGFLKSFSFCITIKTILTFSICNYLPLLFIILFCSFFFLFHYVSDPHLRFYTSKRKCILLDVLSPVIYFLSYDTLFLNYTKMICFGVTEKTKLNPLTYANFNSTTFSALISPKRI